MPQVPSSNKLRDEEVVDTNEAPVWGSNTTVLFTKNQLEAVDMTGYVTDPDGDPLTITVNQAMPQGVSFANNILRYDGQGPASDASGFVFTASDGAFEIESGEFRIAVVNYAPVWTTISNIVNSEGNEQTLDISQFVSDENNDTIAITIKGTVPTGVTFDGTTLTIGAGVAVGTYPGIYFEASDGTATTNSNTITITQQASQSANQPPVWGAVGTLSFTNGTAKSVNLLQYVSDPEGDTITVTSNNPLPTGFTLSGTTISFSGSGTVGDYGGLTFRASDGEDTADSPPFTFRVTAAPSAGVSQLPPWITIDHDNQRIIVAADAPGGEHGPFELGLTGANDQVEVITWDAGTSLEVSPGQTVPYSSILTDDSSHTVVRDVGNEPTWSTDILINSDQGYGIFGYWNPNCIRLTDYIIKGISTSHGGIVRPPTGGTEDRKYYEVKATGTVQSYDGTNAVLDPDDNENHNLGDRFLRISSTGEDWRRITSYDRNTNTATLGAPIYGTAWDGPVAGEPYEVYVKARQTDDRPLPAGLAQYPPYADYTSVAYPHFNLNDDYFWIDHIGTLNDAGEDNGCCFVDTVPCAYPLTMSVMDNNFQDPGKWVKVHSVVGTLPAGFTYDPFWGELIYDGTKLGEYEGRFAFRVEDARGIVKERSFKLRVLVPTYVYGPNGTHWAAGSYGDPVGSDVSFTQFCRDCKADVGNAKTGSGNPVIWAVEPHVFDYNRQAELARLEGFKVNGGASGNAGIMREAQNTSEQHLVSYTGEEMDRTLDENRVDFLYTVNDPGLEDLAYPGTYFTGSLVEGNRENNGSRANVNVARMTARTHFTQRQTIVGVNANSYDVGEKIYRNIHLQHCGFNRGYSIPTGASEIGFSRAFVHPYSCPTHSTCRDVRVFGGGNNSYAHLMYNHGGDRGRANYDQVRMYENAGGSGNMLKAYSCEQYFRDCHFSSIENIEEIDDPTSDHYWENYKSIFSTGTAQAYTDGNKVTLDLSETQDHNAGTRYLRITSTGEAWRKILSYDTGAKIVTLGDPIYGPAWTGPVAGEPYEIYEPDYVYTGGPNINSGAAGLTVVENCLFENFAFDAPGADGIGTNFVFDCANRREWASAMFPYYGTVEYMSAQWWDDFTHLHGGAANPLNPYSHKIYMRNNVFRKYIPTSPALQNIGHVAIALRGFYPETVLWYPDVPQGGTKTGYMYVPLTNPETADGEYLEGATQAWSPVGALFESGTKYLNYDFQSTDTKYNLSKYIKSGNLVSEYSNWDWNYWNNIWPSGDFPDTPVVQATGGEAWQR